MADYVKLKQLAKAVGIDPIGLPKNILEEKLREHYEANDKNLYEILEKVEGEALTVQELKEADPAIYELRDLIDKMNQVMRFKVPITKKGTREELLGEIMFEADQLKPLDFGIGATRANHAKFTMANIVTFMKLGVKFPEGVDELIDAEVLSILKMVL